MIVITPEESKTKKGRYFLVLDEGWKSGFARDFLASMKVQMPSSFTRRQLPIGNRDASNAQKAVRQLYMRLSKTLDIPLLSEARSHVWRTTLNNEWIAADIDEAARAGALGHTGDVNQQFYRDPRDLSVFEKVYRKKKSSLKSGLKNL